MHEFHPNPIAPLADPFCRLCLAHRQHHAGEVAASLTAAADLIAPTADAPLLVVEALGYGGVLAAYALTLAAVVMGLAALA